MNGTIKSQVTLENSISPSSLIRRIISDALRGNNGMPVVLL